MLVLALATSVDAADRDQPPPSFAPIADSVKAAVVSIVMEDEDEDTRDDGEGSHRETLQRLLDALLGSVRSTIGAAVVIDPDGTAVTGARILRNLTEVSVVTLDGARHRASIVGRDEPTDIAVLRIKAPGPLPAATLGDSDEVRVGDWVLAIGSPYGFETSVSVGIVSARARVSPAGAHGEVLQTDASIDPGSAGGPLINVDGRMIGLATAVAPRGAGIGFAIASNVVRKVVADIRLHGHVVRSWLGVVPQTLTAELAAAFRMPFVGGVVFADVVAGGPAAKAGLTRGDVVVAFDRRPVPTVADLERELRAVGPGQTRTLHVWRNTRERQVAVVLGQEPAAAILRRHWGAAVDGVTPELGVVVMGVAAGSPASNAGLLRGDIVRELDGRAVRSLAEFEKIAGGFSPGRTITLLVQRDGTPRYVVLQTPQREVRLESE